MWLVVAILAYLFFGLASLSDKIVLAGKPKPKAYTFYVGVFGLLAVLLIPFINFGFPSYAGLFWIVLYSIVHLIGIYAMYSALERFDVSKVIATIGATQPIFIFILTLVFWGFQPMSVGNIFAFILLLVGSIIISIEKNLKITADYLKITILSSVMFSLDYILLKFVFLNQPFLQGVIWTMIFMFLFVLIFLFRKDSRKEIFEKQMVSDKKTQALFLCAQGCGGAGNFLQSFAISLAPVAFLATVNSLRGIQYVFLFLVTLFFSFFYPKILKEEFSKKIIIQKIVSIVLIGIGLTILIY